MNGVIIPTGMPNGFKIWGYSVNMDFLLHNQVLWRLEGRGVTCTDPIFNPRGIPLNTNAFITSSLAMAF